MSTGNNIPLIEQKKKVWGWYNEEGEFYEHLTYKEACDKALEHKKKYPDDNVVIFKIVATVENQPEIVEVS
ncbi:MAG: hypothetical protein ACRC6V_18090 [Bacteroidales bacterium]